MTISKFFIIGLFSIGMVLGNSQKISIGGIKSTGITEKEVEILKQEIDNKIQSTAGFTLTNYKIVNKKLNQESSDLLDCPNLACAHEIAHIFGLNAVISSEVIFHENGVNIMVNIFSHWKEEIILEINEEHAPLKFSAVVELITNNYVPELLDTFSKLVRPSIQIIEPAKFYSIPETNKLNILLNLADNRGLKNYTVKYSKNGGRSFKDVQSGELNNELRIEAKSISIPLTGGITDKGMVQVVVTDIDGNTKVRNSELFNVEDNTPPYISLISPTKSEIIKGSNEYNITWEGRDNLGISSYGLFYSTNNGESYQTIAEINGTFSNFIWNVPDLLTNNCYIKIIALDHTGLKSEDSIGPLSVMDGANPTFTIMTKVKGKSYPENTKLEAVLNLRDNTGVKVVEAYYTNDKINFELLSQTVFDNLVQNKNSNFKLILPYGVTSDAQIKWVVRDLFENETSLFTEKFNITDNSPPSNEIVYPVKGVKFKGLEQGKIIWSATDNTTIASHETYYSLNNGKSWHFIGKSGGDKNNIIWDIPDVNTKTAKLKLITKDIVGLSSETISNIFEIKDIINPTIELVQPKDFSQYRERDSIKIQINLKDNIGLRNSQVYLKIGAQSHSLNNTTYPEGTKTDVIFIKQLLSALPQDNISLIIIATDEGGNQTNFTTDSFNLIDNTPPVVSFNTSLAGEIIDGKSKFKLNWSARDNVGIKQVRLELTDNGGETWNNIKTFNSKVEEYLWHVPNLHSDQCKIRISVIDVNNFSSEIITSNFSINDKSGPELVVLNPGANESFKEYEIINVSVLAQDDYGLGLIELYYSSDGYNFDYISNEAFTPDVTQDTISFTVKIKEGLSYKSLFKFIGLDRFNNESEIVSPTFKVIDNTPPIVEFKLSLPTNEFGTGKAYNINWNGSDNLNLSNTKLEYSSDNGESWTELFSTPLNGKETKQTYTWLIPVDLKSPCQLKASITDKMDLNSTTIYSDFKIVDQTNPEIKFNSYPAKTVNETQNYNIDLELTDNYDLSSIDFYYSGNLKDFNYISSVSNLEGKTQNILHELTIPKGFSKSAIIKLVLTDGSGNTTTKFTETFEVIDFTNPSISMTSKIPEILLNGEQLEISWSASDNEALNSHLIEFSNDSGKSWNQLSRLPGSQSKWTWDIPDIVSENKSKLRIITIDHVDLTDTINTNLFSIKDETSPELFIPVSKYHIEVKENDTLYQAFEIRDNVQIKSLKVEYSNIPRQFKTVADLDFEIENSSSKSLKVGIPIPPGATKNAKLKATLTDNSGNTVEQLLKGIRVMDNTVPNVKFVEPTSTENLDNAPILIIGDTLWFQWESKDNTGIRSNRISYKLVGTDYWQPILTTRGDESSLSWTIPEKAVGTCDFQIIATDKVGLQSKHVIGPFEIQDVLDESRQDLLRKYGSLSIESNPSGAMVMVDNIEKGYTPLKVDNLSEGNHRLVLFKRQFKHVSKIVQIQSDSVLTINEILEEKE